MQNTRSPSRSAIGTTSSAALELSKGPKVPEGFTTSIQDLGGPIQSTQPLFSPTGFASLFGSSSATNVQSTTGSAVMAPGGEQYQQSAPQENKPLCKIGQGLVHEIVQKMVDLFQVLRTTQLPSHAPSHAQMYYDKQKHVQDSMKMIMTYFKQLKQIYVTVSENCSKMNLRPVEDLIPLADEHGTPSVSDPQLQTDVYKQLAAEHATLTETLKAKNAHLKEIIDQLRCLLWEINTMMSMKNSKT